jgi:OmpA-OmpF porin, OOP family
MTRIWHFNQEYIMKSTSIVGLAIALAMITTAAHSAGAEDYRGFYVGIGAGISGFDLEDPAAPSVDDSLRGGVLKLFSGYQFNRFLGVESGFSRTGNFNETRTVSGASVKQSAKSRAFYTAVTGRIPIGETFALTGKLGVARGKVYGDDEVTGPDSLYGHDTSTLVGFGGQYRIGEKTDLQLDIEGFDKLSNRVSAGTVTMSVRRRF